MKINRQFYLIIGMLLASSAMASDQTSSRVQLLEKALQPANPQAVVNMYATAVKNRNGAVQYMLLCKPLQAKNLKDYQAMNWVTGTSSPSVSNYKITEVALNHYTIDYNMSLQGKVVDTMQDKIEISQESNDGQDRYCIASNK